MIGRAGWRCWRIASCARAFRRARSTAAAAWWSTGRAPPTAIRRAAAARLFREALWPGHPFRLDPLGTAETLAGLGRVRLLDHYRRHYPVSHLVVSVVGDVDPKEVVATLTALFADAAAGAAPPDPPPEPVHTEPVALFRPTGKDVAEIVLGYPGPDRARSRSAGAGGARRGRSGGRLDRALGRTSPASSASPPPRPAASIPASWRSPSPARRRPSTPWWPRFAPRSPRWSRAAVDRGRGGRRGPPAGRRPGARFAGCRRRSPMRWRSTRRTVWRS